MIRFTELWAWENTPDANALDYSAAVTDMGTVSESAQQQRQLLNTEAQDVKILIDKAY